MKLSTKIFFCFCIAIVILSTTVAIYFYYQLESYKKISNDKILFLNENVTSLKTRVAKQKDIINAINKNGVGVIGSDEEVTSLTTFSSVVKTKNTKDTKPNHAYKDKYSFYELRFSDGPPIGYVLVFKDGSYVSKIYDHEILVNNALGRDKKTGKLKSYATVNLILKKDGLANRKDSRLKKWKDKPYPLRVTQGETIYSDTAVDTKKFRFKIIPSLNGSVRTNSKGKIDVAPSIGVSVAQHGYKESPNWKIGNVSVGYKDKAFIEVAPVMRKVIGKNTYIGPNVSVDEDVKVRVGATISLNF